MEIPPISVEVGFEQHNYSKFFNDRPPRNLLKNRIDTFTPAPWGEAML
jgi:hypothetical protein